MAELASLYKELIELERWREKRRTPIKPFIYKNEYLWVNINNDTNTR